MFNIQEILLKQNSRADFLANLHDYSTIATRCVEADDFIKLALTFNTGGDYSPLPALPVEFPPSSNPSQLLTNDQFSLLWGWMPHGFQITEPRLIYSTKVDGFSLHRLYLRCQEIAPLILIIRSLENNIFGAFLADALQIKFSSYYGTGETFLFSIVPIPMHYRWSHCNRYMLFVEQNQLACGGGGNTGYGLSIDDELLNGCSMRCATFENEPLNAGNEEFQCSELEVIACM